MLIVLAMALMLLPVAWSCADVGCIENRSSIPYAGFYSYQTRQSISIDSVQIGGVGAPHDSLLVNTGDVTSAMYFPFRFEYDNTAFYIRYKSKALDFDFMVDTIKFDYTTLPYFASEECGAMYRYVITSVRHTTHLIDSIGVIDSLITNFDKEYFKIFFRTAIADEDYEN